MFTSASLQVIRDYVEFAIQKGKKKDKDLAEDIIAYCDTNIKAVCGTCGGDGMKDLPDGTKDAVKCDACSGTGKGPLFDALLGEMGERNKKVQERAKRGKV